MSARAKIPDLDAPRRFKATARRRWLANVRRYWHLYAIGTVLLIATNLLALEIPDLLGSAINALREARTEALSRELAYEAVVDAAGLIVLLAVGAALTRVLSRITMFNAGRLVEYDLRNEVFEHLTRLAPGDLEVASGDLTSRVSNDATNVRLLFGFGVLNVVNTAVAFVAALSKMLSISPWLTLWCLLPYPVGFWLMRTIVREMYRRTRVVQATLGELTGEVQQTVSGIAVIKSYAVEPSTGARFAGQSQRFVDDNMHLARVRGMMAPLMGLLGSIGSLIVLYLGGRLAITGGLSLGEFVEFSAYVVILAWPTVALGFVLGVWQRGMASFDRILEVLDVEPSVRSPQGGAREPIGGAIELRDVTVELGGRRVLDSVSFSVAPGEHVALVGLTGAGKSTLIDLVPRLRDASAGEVLIDGRPVTQWDLEHLRAAIGYVPQDPFLFSATVRENLEFGLDEAARADTSPERQAHLQRAIELAGLTSDLERFPKGLETPIGERGLTVSGGQKQRMTIARALLTEPAILLLDDALSSVDPGTEREIFESLSARRRRCTILMATHRFVGLTAFDRIVVLDHGRVVEQGSFEALCAAGGAFSALWERQQLEARLETL